MRELSVLVIIRDKEGRQGHAPLPSLVWGAYHKWGEAAEAKYVLLGYRPNLERTRWSAGCESVYANCALATSASLVKAPAS